jgi:hypothetical protein
MQTHSKEFIEKLATDIFSDQNIRVDIDVIFPQVTKYNLSTKDIAKILIFISDNFDFFADRLKYPLQASNLLLYCIDAIKIPEKNWRGSHSRNDITKELQDILKIKL